MQKVTKAIPPRAPRRRAPRTNASAGSYAGLERSQLVDAALHLLREAGLEALSTRRVAERLGVKSPALYWHVRDKSELLGLVADAICAHMKLPSKRLSFRRRLADIAWEYRRVLRSYRDAPRLFADQAPTGPHRMRLYDAAIGAFLDAGFAPSIAVSMATFYRNYLLGMVTEETRQSSVERSNVSGATVALGVELAALGDEASRYPNLRRVAGQLVGIDPETLFQIGLDVLLDGMQGRVPGKRRRATT
jgi:TetR/AcrR family tetracycline transcriptional repressor